MNMGRQMQFKSTDKREFETRRKKHLESVGGSVSPDRHNSQNESPQQLLSTQEVQIRNLLVDNKDDAKWARAKRLGKIIRGEDSAINLYSPGTPACLTDGHKGIINEATVRMQIWVRERRREGGRNLGFSRCSSQAKKDSIKSAFKPQFPQGASEVFWEGEHEPGNPRNPASRTAQRLHESHGA